MMIFSRRNILSTTDPISLNGSIIKPFLTVRFLGVFFDPKLTGNAYMDYIINKSKKILQIISALRGVWWGSHPQLLCSLYIVHY